MKHLFLAAMLVLSVVGCQSSQFNVDFEQASAKKKKSKSQNVKEVRDFLLGIIDAAAENKYKLNYKSKVMDKINDFKSYDELLKAKKHVLMSFIRIDNYKNKFMGTGSYKSAMIHVIVKPEIIQVDITSQPEMNKQSEDAYRDLRDKMQEYIDKGIVSISRRPELKVYY